MTNLKQSTAFCYYTIRKFSPSFCTQVLASTNFWNPVLNQWVYSVMSNTLWSLYSHEVNVMIFFRTRFNGLLVSIEILGLKRLTVSKMVRLQFVLFHNFVFFWHLALITVMNENWEQPRRSGIDYHWLKMYCAVFRPAWECSWTLRNAKWNRVSGTHKREFRDEWLSSVYCGSVSIFFRGWVLIVIALVFSSKYRFVNER